MSASNEDTNQRHLSTSHLSEGLQRRMMSSGFVTLVSQGAQFGLTLAGTVILARLLSPSDFGLVGMVNVVLGFLRIFRDAGLTTVTIQRQDITHAQVSNLFWINAALSGSISVVVAIGAPLVAWFYGEPRLVPITLALAGTFLLTGLGVQHLAILNRQMRFQVIAIIQIGSLGIATAAGVAAAWFGLGYWSLVVMYLLWPGLSLLLTWWLSPWRPRLPTRHAGTLPLVHFGMNLSVSSLVYSLARGMDSLLIGRFHGVESLGLYTRAQALLTRPIEQLLGPINSVMVPALSRLQNDPATYRRTFLQVYEVLALFGFVFSGLFLALARPLTLVILGPKWEHTAPIFGNFALMGLFYPLSSTCSWLFASQGRGRDWLITTIITSVLTVAAFAGGLPFGPAGVALAFSLSGIFLLLPAVFAISGRSGPVHTADLWRVPLRLFPVTLAVYGGAAICLVGLDGSLAINQAVAGVIAGLGTGGAFAFAYPPARTVIVRSIGAIRQWLIERRTPQDPE